MYFVYFILSFAISLLTVKYCGNQFFESRGVPHLTLWLFRFDFKELGVEFPKMCFFSLEKK